MDISRMPKEGDKFGNWIIERTLDKGGMGMVYLVRNPTLRVERALKVLDPAIAEKDREFVDRFNQEASLVCGIHSPNLVEVYDAGCDGASGLYYIVMEYLGGGTLRDRMRSQGPMPWRDSLEIVRQVALALAAVAKRNSVHRDIKPENIMFTADGVVKLADFGIAKASQDDEENMLKTLPDQAFGTPAYMSPEQVKDASSVDARADIWSLGVVLFEMISGVRPYPAKSMIEVAAFLLSEKPFPDIRTFKVSIVGSKPCPTVDTMRTLPTLASSDNATPCGLNGSGQGFVREMTVEVPDAVARFLSRMCEKDVNRRIATGEEVVAAIDEILGRDSASGGTVATPVSSKSAASVCKQKPVVSGANRARWMIRIVSVGLGVFIVAMVVLMMLRMRGTDSGRMVEPKASVDVANDAVDNPLARVVEHVASDEMKLVSCDVLNVATKKDETQWLTNVQIVIRREDVSPKNKGGESPESQFVLFQPQRGTADSVLSGLDEVIRGNPVRLKVSLSYFAQRNNWSVGRYESQLLVPAIERLHSAGVHFSLIPGPGKYGAAVQDVAKRLSCDVE